MKKKIINYNKNKHAFKANKIINLDYLKSVNEENNNYFQKKSLPKRLKIL